jgi:AraC-like DNA-binding protein
MKRKETYYVVSNPYAEDSRLQALFAGYSQTRSAHQVGPKVFDYYLLHHIVQGSGTFTCGEQVYNLTKGDSFMIAPGALVSYTADLEDPWQYRWLAFQGQEVTTLLQHAGLSIAEPTIISPAANRIGKWIEQIQITFDQRKTGGHMRAYGYLCLILAEIQEVMHPEARQETVPYSQIERHIKQVVQQLTTQYAEPISIERLAESLGYNRAYFSKMFKRYTHVAPVTFLLNLRIGKARQLLRERTELTIEQIAYSVGFNDPLYFSKQFRSYYGLSPTEYRKSIDHLKKT